MDRKCVIICCVFGLGTLLSQSATPVALSDPVQARTDTPGRLIAVLAGDTDDPRIGKSVARDLENVKRLLEDGCRSFKGTVRYEVLRGKDFSRQALRQVLAGL